jgi:flavin reductase (DIM6/NTAB) family NADH-FMN oxidoreductase RutF
MTDSFFSLTNHELYVLTARQGDRMSGQIATWILPCTLAPSKGRLVAIISPLNYTHELMAATGRFTVQMLAHDQAHLVPRFGLQSGRDTNKFEGLDPDFTPSGLPLLRGTCGWAECVIRSAVDTGDRRVYVADIIAEHREPGKLPLRKDAAFAAQPPDILRRLAEKALVDGSKSEELYLPMN